MKQNKFALNNKNKLSLIIVLIFISLVLMFLGQNKALSKIKMLIVDMTSGFAYIVTTSFSKAGDFTNNIQEMWQLQKSYRKIKLENEYLRASLAHSEHLIYENSQLKKLLNFSSTKLSEFHTAKILSIGTGQENRSLVLFLGLNKGIRAGFIVTTPEGLVGKVQSTGLTTAMVSPITSWDSNTSVLIGKYKKIQAIATGKNKDQLVIDYVNYEQDSEISVGDEVVTSGGAGVYPYNVKVGVVSSILNNKIYITPYVNIKGEAYVVVSDYNLKTFIDDFLKQK